MKRIIAVIACLGALSPVAQADVSANVGVTSNYVFRGFSQTNGNPAIQGGIDYIHASGFYAGAWASQVDCPPTSDCAGVGGTNNDCLVVDTYAGLATELKGGYLIDLGIIQYYYTDSNKKTQRELYFGLGHGPFMGTYYWGDDTGPANADYKYLDLKYKFDLGDDVGLTLHYGRKDYDQQSAVNDISASLNKEVLGVDVRVTATAEDKAGSKREELFLTLTRTFDIK